MSVMEDSVIVMGLHPSPERWPDRARIEVLTSGLKGRVCLASEIASGMNTLLAIACIDPARDFVTGPYGGTLTTAAYNGYRVVLVEGPGIWSHFYAAFPGAMEHQLRVLAGTPVLLVGTMPIDWDNLLFPSEKEVKTAILPFDADRAVCAVCELA